jgi:hypothetical protein
MAHGAFIAAIILDGFGRESVDIASYVFSIGSAICILPASIYFLLNPRSFFLLPSQRRHSGDQQAIGRALKIALFLASWAYFVVVWALIWLLIFGGLPQLIACYTFMFGVMTTSLLEKCLFFRARDKRAALI